MQRQPFIYTLFIGLITSIPVYYGIYVLLNWILK